ncbi:class I SAM-dependent DNA methyltransferase [Trichloromonas sp.]|uniref:class I SAM-dependent DNA methyltransferase n=1 Tax=Trichloromonas sp. TaxID=3069249 RepID=UPI003D815507
MTVFGAYSRYYNLLYKDKDYPGEAQYVNELIVRHCPAAKTVLDLGCGTGRHDLLLAEKGYEVTGVDQSGEMLAVAHSQRETSKGQRFSSTFLQGDIRSVRLDRSFDVVVSLFHVMSYQVSNDDLRAAFATVRAHLKPGGVFIFDCWYGPAVLTDRPVVRVRRLEDDETAVTRIAEPVMQGNDNLVEVHYHMLVRDKASGAMDDLHEIHRMRYLFRPEIELLLRETGMAVIESFEWMTGRQPGFDTWGVCFVVRG